MFTRVDEEVVWKHVRQIRLELVEYLVSLSTSQWNHTSLCAGWKSRDVVAHLILEYHYKSSESWKDFVLSGFNVNRFMKNTAVNLGKQPTAELIKQFQSMVDERHKPTTLPVMNVLVDLLVHEQDIRIPLGQPKDINLDLLKLVFSHWELGDYNFGEKITGLAARLKGLKFTITDLGILKGSGADVVGNAQDILLAAVGRTVSINRLSGEGVEVLKGRLK